MRPRRLAISLALAAGPATVVAQAAERCPDAPGALFGVIGFRCAGCAFEAKAGGHAAITYLSEPVVTDAQQGGGLSAGDVIAAVDGLPITTQAGADRFSYPTVGAHSVTVRRGRDQQDVHVQIARTCPHTWSTSFSWSSNAASAQATLTAAERASERAQRLANEGIIPRKDAEAAAADVAKARKEQPGSRGDDGIHVGTGSGSHSSSGSGVGIGTPVLGGDPLVIINGVPDKSGSGADRVGRFGFGVECRNTCVAKRMPNGSYVYRYDSYPAIVAVRPGSVADRTGLRVGDEIITINGRSILADDALVGSDGSDELKMTVKRDGKLINVLLLMTH